MRSPRLRRAAVVLTTGLVLAACSRNAEPQPIPPIVRPTAVTQTSTPGTPSTSPTGSPGVPHPAQAHTAPGAQAFAEFYLSQLNKAWMTPDPAFISPYATKNCKTCANFEKSAREMRRNSSHYTSSPVKLLSAAWLPESTADHVTVSVNLTQNDTTIVSPSATKSISGGPAVVELEVRWLSAAWLVDAIHWVVAK